MHSTAMLNCRYFFDCYAKSFDNKNKITVIEIGSQDVNGSLRDVTPSHFEYIGVDFVPGKGVDVVLTDPYSLPFESDKAEIVISSSCFEHSEHFWLVHLEVMRILKPNGIFYLNVPSNQSYHRYPVDCWRFYPDSGKALVSWANRNGFESILLESYVAKQGSEGLNDFVAVFLKDKKYINNYRNRIIQNNKDFKNGWTYGEDKLIHESYSTEDKIKMQVISQIISNEITIN